MGGGEGPAHVEPRRPLKLLILRLMCDGWIRGLSIAYPLYETPMYGPVTRLSIHRRPSRGFSLLELLVVIVILGVIVVAAIPTISKYLPRYRMERVAENLTQACRIARNGAVSKHCNHAIRFWADADRTTLASSGDPIRAFDVLLDRNNNMTYDPPSGGGTDDVIKYPVIYDDVAGFLDPDNGNLASQQPYPSFPNVPNPLVFRPDGQVYDYQAGVFVDIPQVAILIQSLTLPDTDPLTATKSTYKFRWVELDRLGSVHVQGLRR